MMQSWVKRVFTASAGCLYSKPKLEKSSSTESVLTTNPPADMQGGLLRMRRIHEGEKLLEIINHY